MDADEWPSEFARALAEHAELARELARGFESTRLKADVARKMASLGRDVGRLTRGTHTDARRSIASQWRVARKDWRRQDTDLRKLIEFMVRFEPAWTALLRLLKPPPPRTASRGRPRLLTHNFADSLQQADMGTALLRFLTPSAQLHAVGRDGQAHYRRMTIVWHDGNVISITLDQGFGLFEARPVAGGNVEFMNYGAPERVASELAKKKFRVAASNQTWTSDIFISPLTQEPTP